MRFLFSAFGIRQRQIPLKIQPKGKQSVFLINRTSPGPPLNIGGGFKAKLLGGEGVGARHGPWRRIRQVGIHGNGLLVEFSGFNRIS